MVATKKFYLRGFLALALAILEPSAFCASSTPKQLLDAIGPGIGLTHWAGGYAFSSKNYLEEGAELAQDLGARRLFITLDRNFRRNYPGQDWPVNDPSSLAELAQLSPYLNILANAQWKLIVLNSFSIANGDLIMNLDEAMLPSWREQEYKETKELAGFLLQKFQNTGKVFVIKNWESDWFAQSGFNPNYSLSEQALNRFVDWQTARQSAIRDARAEFQGAGVTVLHATEVNLVKDIDKSKASRVLNAAIPRIRPDLVAYSAWDAIAPDGGSALSNAIRSIDRLAPDPLGLGRARIFISEMGIGENRPKQLSEKEIQRRTKALVKQVFSAGVQNAFAWQIYDNDCNGAPIAIPPEFPARPQNADCAGNWIRKPSGEFSAFKNVLSAYF